MKEEELQLGKYYLVQSRFRLGGGSFIGKLQYYNSGMNVCMKVVGTNKVWWTHTRYLIKEVPEDEAVLSALGE